MLAETLLFGLHNMTRTIMLKPGCTSPISPSIYRVTHGVFAIQHILEGQLSLHWGSVQYEVMRSGYVPAYCVAVRMYVLWKVCCG